MDLKGWAEKKEPDPAARDELLKRVYLSEKMMKYHPLMTKELRKTYSLLAAAVMRAMSPEFKYGIKKQFNKMSTALKAMRQKMKAEKALYGPVAKRGLYGKIDFWNRLMDVPIGSADAPLLLAGYEPDILKANANYKPSGLLGKAETYADYKNDLAERREKIRQKMLLLKDSEKSWYRQRARLWSKGRKRARDAIKAYKARLEADNVNPIQLARFNPEKTLAKMYEEGFDAEIADKPDFYKDDALKADMLAEMAKPVHLPWFKQAYRKYAKGQRFADAIPGREKYAPLTLGNRAQPYQLSQLAHSTTADPNRLLTQKMRQAGTTLDNFNYMIPRNREEYLQKHPPKAAAAADAKLAIQPMNVPQSNLPPISSSPTSIPATQASQVSPSNASTQPPSSQQEDDYDSEEDEVMEPTDGSVNAGWGWGWY